MLYSGPEAFTRVGSAIKALLFLLQDVKNNAQKLTAFGLITIETLPYLAGAVDTDEIIREYDVR